MNYLFSRNCNIFDISEDELLVDLSNLFGAGAETTATTITWAFYFMVLHPEIQRKTQAVIDAKIERNRNVTVDDKGIARGAYDAKPVFDFIVLVF